MTEYRFELPQFAYKFDLLLAALQRFVHPSRQVIRGNQLWRVTNGIPVTYFQADDAIICRSNHPMSNEIIDRSQHIVGLNTDLTEFYSFAKSDRSLWTIIEPIYGMPIFCTETLFEALVTLIVEQHITWKNALCAEKTLMECFQTPYIEDDITVYDFPSPEQLASASPESLKPLKITNRRIDLIIQIAQDVVSGQLDLDAIQMMDPENAYQTLLQIKGVGHWTANNVIGRAFGKFPYVSHNDVALQSAVNHYFHQDIGEKSAQQVRETLAPYGEYAGLVGHLTLLRWVLDRYPSVN